MSTHLGGHLNVTHVDNGALAWLHKKLNAKTFLDVGCSIGGMVNAALALGLDAYGFDGDYSLTTNKHTLCLNRIFFNDLTRCCPLLPVNFDVIWCVEVAEHIEEKYSDNLLGMLANNLQPSGLLVFTANEGPGVNHVNRKPMSWWENRLRAHDLRPCPLLTKELRAASTMDREFIRNTGIVCQRTVK